MILETIITTIFIEKIRPFFIRKPKNNLKAIIAMDVHTTFTNVGELRELLKNFADDTQLRGSGQYYPHLQKYELDGKGLLFLGSSSHHNGESPYGN